MSRSTILTHEKIKQLQSPSWCTDCTPGWNSSGDLSSLMGTWDDWRQSWRWDVCVVLPDLLSPLITMKAPCFGMAKSWILLWDTMWGCWGFGWRWNKVGLFGISFQSKQPLSMYRHTLLSKTTMAIKLHSWNWRVLNLSLRFIWLY
jgi:hypothetical protein